LKELIKTNDAVLISYVEALLSEAGIAFVVADRNMSVLEGSVGVLPRRVLVPDAILFAARNILNEAGIDVGAPGGPA